MAHERPDRAGHDSPGCVFDPSGLYKQGTAPTAFRNGLDYFINSEHGGIRARDGFGRNWKDTTVYPLFPAIGDPTNGQMWRWQSLIRTSRHPRVQSGACYLGAYDWILGIRANYPNKLVMTGMEWNAPGHEHAARRSCPRRSADRGVRIPLRQLRHGRHDNHYNGSDHGVVRQEAEQYIHFSRLFCRPGLNAKHNKTMDAVRWMQANYPNTGYIIPAHIERAGCGVGG